MEPVSRASRATSCHNVRSPGDAGLERIPQDPTAHASLCAGTAPEGGDVAVAAKEATAVPASRAFSCLLYSRGLFLGWREAAA